MIEAINLGGLVPQGKAYVRDNPYQGPKFLIVTPLRNPRNYAYSQEGVVIAMRDSLERATAVAEGINKALEL